MRNRIVAMAMLLAACTGRLARADDKQLCIAAADEAQQERIDGKLRAARSHLLVCGRTQCPPLVRSDCEKWMSDLIALLPTIVIAVRDAQGRDVAAVNVSIDGVVVARGLDGKPIEVDPGMHTLRVDAPATGQALEQQLLVREGEKGRPVTLTLPATVGQQTTQSYDSTHAPIVETPRSGISTRPAAETVSGVTPPSKAASPWPWILGATGIVAVGVGAALELSVNAQASSLASSCVHSCKQSDVRPLVLEQQVLGPVAFGIGAVSLGAATYLFLFHRASGATASGARAPIRWDLGAAPGLAFGQVAVQF